jgi:hypothetical protein
MNKLLAIIFLLVSVSAAASYSARLGPDESQWSDTDFRKTKNGFSGMLLVMPDTDWEQRWNAPPDIIPRFREAKVARVGERLVILMFLVNPGTDENKNANVICSIKTTRPDNTISINERGIPCMKGELQGNPNNVHLSPAIIKFVGEENDPLGRWLVEVEIEDVNRNTTLHLKTHFMLEPSRG